MTIPCAAWASSPKARAGCGKPARPDPWRGLWATMIPTPTFGKSEDTLAGAGDSPYSGVVTRQHLSIRCRLQRPAPLEGLSPVVARRGVQFVAGRGVSCQLFHKPFLPRLPPAFAAGG